MFVINCKNYPVDALKIRKIAEGASKRFDVKVAIAPQQAALAYLARGSSIPVLAQHVDNKEQGGSTGYIVPETLKELGVRGSLLNHSEHRIPQSDIVSLVRRLDGLGMVSIVCVGTPRELAKYAILTEPTYFAIEPPELIGTGRAVSKQKPRVISSAADILEASGSRSELLCGAGIVTGEDVAAAVSLRAVGILVASGVIKATDVKKKVYELAGALARNR